MSDQDKKLPGKKTYQSNSPLKKDNYHGNEFEDETDLKELAQQEIDEVDVDEDIDQGVDNESMHKAEVKLASLTEDEIVEGVDDPLIKKLLARLSLRKKKKKSLNYISDELVSDLERDDLDDKSKKINKKVKKGVLRNISSRLFQAFRKNPNLQSDIAKASKQMKDQVGVADANKDSRNFLNNDLAPDLGNEGLSTTSMSEADIKKRSGTVLKDVKERIAKDQVVEKKSKRDQNDLNNNGIDDTIEKQEDHKQDHIQQLADAINDLGEHSKKGRWADTMSDSNVKGEDGPKKGGGRGI